MSRIGKQPVAVPKGVEVTVSGTHMKFKGPMGELEHDVWDGLTVEYQAAERHDPDRAQAETTRTRAPCTACTAP